MSENLPFVSIVIVLYNSKEFIGKCIESLSEINYPDFEIIILDNASRDGSFEKAQNASRRYPSLKVTFLKESTNLGFAGGNNKAIQHAKGEIIVLLNPDTTVREDWLKHLINAMFQHGDVGIAGCKIFYPDGKTIQHAGGVIYSNGVTEHIGYREIDEGGYDKVREVDYVSGAAFAIKREVFDKIGFLDEDYFPAYFEETDFCFKAKEMGYKILYVPEAVVYHYESPNITTKSYRFYYLYHKNRLKFVLKNWSKDEIFHRFLPAEFKYIKKKSLKSYIPLFHAYFATLGFVLCNIFCKSRSKKTFLI